MAGDARSPKTLFIRLSSLGDIILTEPTVRAYKNARPGAEIHFLTKGGYEEVVGLFPEVDRVVATPPGRLTTRGLMTVIEGLRREDYDTVVDLQRNMRSLGITRMLSVPEKTGYYKAAFKRRLMPLGFFRARGVEHTARRYLTSLERLGLPGNGVSLCPALSPGPAAGERARSILAAAGWDGRSPLVAVIAGSRWPSKRWPAANFAALIRGLKTAGGAFCVLLGNVSDRPVTGEVMAGLAGEAADLTGRTSLEELAAVLRKADLAVTNDSGPMHLASAVGTRVLAVFGPTIPTLGFAPLGEGDRIFQAPLGCRPCSIHGSKPCRRGDLRCMVSVEPERLVREALAVLEEVAG